MIAAASVNWHYLLILIVPSVFVIVATALTWYSRSRRPPGSGSGRSAGSSGTGGKTSGSGGKTSGSGGKSSGSGGKRSGSGAKRRRA